MKDTETCLFCSHDRTSHVDVPHKLIRYCEECGELCEQEEHQKEGDD